MLARSSFKFLHRRHNKLPLFPLPSLRPHTTAAVLASPSNDTFSSTILTQLLHPNDQWHRNPTSRSELLKLHGYLKSPNSLILFTKYNPSTKSFRICNVLMMVLLKLGRIDDALKVLDEMLEADSGFLLDGSTAGIIFGELVKREKNGRNISDEEVVRLVKKLGLCGVFPDALRLTQMVGGLCGRRNCGAAWDILNCVMELGGEVEAASCNALLVGLGEERDIEGMKKVLAKMKEMNIWPNVEVFGIIVNHFCEAQRSYEALEVSDKLRGKEGSKGVGVDPNLILLNALTEGLCKDGREEERLSLLEKMKTRSKLRPTNFSLANGAGHLPKLGNLPLKFRIHQSLGLTSNRIHKSPIRNCHSHSLSLLRHIRCMSNVPENTVYLGPTPQNPNQRVTLTQLRQKHRNSQPITMVTAYDYPSAVHLDMAGIDICLVGDSGAMVVHGHDTTLPITVDEMLIHCRAVARGAKRPLLVGDLPFGSYESSTSQAVDTAVRILKEGGMDAIKLEGGSPSRIVAAKAIVEAGIAVMGHVGLTPQAISVLGGFRPQGRNIASAVKVVETALALQEAGCFSVVLECVPAPVAAAATAALQIPTIGIGAGPYCSGQVLVYHDLLGMLQHPHHAKVTPKFCKQYARVGDVINKALLEYKEEVTTGSFPDAHHSPYKISEADATGFSNELQRLGLDKAASAASEAAQKLDTN